MKLLIEVINSVLLLKKRNGNILGIKASDFLSCIQFLSVRFAKRYYGFCFQRTKSLSLNNGTCTKIAPSSRFKVTPLLTKTVLLLRYLSHTRLTGMMA